MDSHLHFGFLKREIETGYFAAGNFFRHLLRGEGTIERITVDKLSLFGTFSVCFQNVDRLDRITLDTLKFS